MQVFRVGSGHAGTYIGRGPGGVHMLSGLKPGQRGWLGNPYVIGPNCTREQSIAKFARAFASKLSDDAEFRKAVEALQGDLLCFCDPLPCHGHVIVAYLES